MGAAGMIGFTRDNCVGHFPGKPPDGFRCPYQQTFALLFLSLWFPFRHISDACTPDTRTTAVGPGRFG